MVLNSKTKSRKSDINEVVFSAVSSVVKKHKVSTWVGTMTDLSAAISKVISKKQKTLLPGSPSALRVALNRVVRRLRSKGIAVKFGRTTDHNRTRFVKFAR